MLTYDLANGTTPILDHCSRRWWRTSGVYSANQRRVAAVKYLGELYIYRLISLGLIFDIFWAFITFGNRKYYILDASSRS
jgi:hypothetical protein